MKYRITLEEAVQLAREVESITVPFGWHVALGGGCLLRGGSDKDVDLVFVPHDGKPANNLPDVVTALGSIFGNFRRTVPDGVTRHRSVLIANHPATGIRVDFFNDHVIWPTDDIPAVFSREKTEY